MPNWARQEQRQTTKTQRQTTKTRTEKAMKKFEVEFKYESYVVYAVEADSQEEAEDKAWELLNQDQKHSYGEWAVETIEERK